MLLIFSQLVAWGLRRSFDEIDVTLPCEKAFYQFKLHYKKKYATNAQLQKAQQIFCGNLSKLLTIRGQEKKGLEVGVNAFMDQDIIKSHYIEMPELEPQILKKEAATGLFSELDGEYHVNDGNISNYNRNSEKPIVVCGQSSQTSSSRQIDSSLAEKLVKNLTIYDTTATEDIHKIPMSVDLREWGIMGKAQDQGTCGSCYAFVARYIMQASVTHDLPYYRKVYQIQEFDNIKNGKLLLSVQFILNNSFGFNKYCGGGNFNSVAVDITNTRVPTMEWDKTFPYTAMFEPDDAALIAPIRPDTISEEFKKQQLIPIHYFNSGDMCPKSIFFIAGTDTTEGINAKKFPNINQFSSTQVETIKKILALGIPLNARMNVGGASVTCDGCNEEFQLYKGGIARGDCNKRFSNHQVTMVGYGHFKKDPVWLMLNSWGSSWGQGGYYMIQIGHNAFCSEMDVSGIVPRFRGFDQDLEPLDIPFNATKLYKENVESTYNFLFKLSVRRGENGMDKYQLNNGTYEPVNDPRNLGWGQWFLVVVIGLLALIWMYFFMKCAFCAPKKVIQKPIYIKTDPESVSKLDFASVREDQRNQQNLYSGLQVN